MEKINHYANELFSTKDEYFNAIFQSLTEKGIRNISVSPATAQWLMLLVRSKNAKRILEIGALGGYSGLCMLKGTNGEAELTSLEINEDFAKLAYENISAAGYGDKVTHIVGDARQSLERLHQEGQQFDFVFIDADKESYRTYVDLTIPLASNGAMIIIDNVLSHGDVANMKLDMAEIPEKKQQRIHFMRDFNEYVAEHPQLFSALLPIGDGVICSIVNK